MWSQGRRWNQSSRFSGTVVGSPHCSRSGERYCATALLPRARAVEADAGRRPRGGSRSPTSRRAAGRCSPASARSGRRRSGGAGRAASCSRTKRLARVQHHRPDRGHDVGRARPGHADPLVGDRLRGERGIPGQPPERVPVGLREVVAGPVRSVPVLATPAMPVRAWPSSEPSTTLRRSSPGPSRTCRRRGTPSTSAPGTTRCVRVAEVLLRDLQLGHERRLRHRAEQRVERLARLEVERAVLHLHEARCRGSVPSSGTNSSVGALDAVGVDLRVVDERAPHHDAAVRRTASASTLAPSACVRP